MFDEYVFSDRLRTLIKEKMSLSEMARQTCISVGTMSRWHTYKILPKLTTIMLILQVLEPTEEDVLWLCGMTERKGGTFGTTDDSACKSGRMA